jgi:hypothetical protein
MKILITGAEIVKNNEFFEVLYKNRLVFRDKMKEVALCTALSREKLEMLLKNNDSSNVRYLMVA